MALSHTAYAMILRRKYGIAKPMAPYRPGLDAEDARKAAEVAMRYLPGREDAVPVYCPPKPELQSVH
jgi:hypothetical protein